MKIKTKYLLAFTTWLCLFAVHASAAQEAQKMPSAQQSPPLTSPTPPANTLTRIQQLEAQLEEMRAELTKLRKTMSASSANGGDATSAIGDTQIAQTAAPQASGNKENKPEARGAQAERNLPGIELGAGRLIPYGTIYFNAFGDSGGTNNADIPLFATPTNGGGISASARQTRIGLRVEGLRALNASVTGVIEADFTGGFPAVAIGENFSVVRLRLANAKFDWERTSVVVGQDWMVFAPNNPVSLANAAIPQFAAAGNPWSRLPQLRVERRFASGVLVQGAVLAPATGDFSTTASFFLQPTSGASARTPFLQSRAAINRSNWLGLKKPGAIGLSAHYGRARFVPAPATVDSFGLALDWNFPLATRVTLAGEGFFGRNLAGFQSAVFQNANTDFAFRDGANLIAGGARAIGTRGGWSQIGLTPPVLKDTLTAYASFGMDDPRDEDLVSVRSRDWRERNLSFAFNFVHRLTPQFSWGLEFRRLETIYFLSGKQTSNHINLGAALSF